jgi:hypothetical protein
MDNGQVFTVHVQDNYDSDGNYKVGPLNSYEEALTLCKKIVDEYLTRCFAEEPPDSAEKIMKEFWSWGEAPLISPIPDGVTSFSAQTYMEERCQEFFAANPKSK